MPIRRQPAFIGPARAPYARIGVDMSRRLGLPGFQLRLRVGTASLPASESCTPHAGPAMRASGPVRHSSCSASRDSPAACQPCRRLLLCHPRRRPSGFAKGPHVAGPGKEQNHESRTSQESRRPSPLTTRPGARRRQERRTHPLLVDAGEIAQVQLRKRHANPVAEARRDARRGLQHLVADRAIRHPHQLWLLADLHIGIFSAQLLRASSLSGNATSNRADL